MTERSEGIAARPLTLGDLAEMPVSRLRGVGPKKGTALTSAGLDSILDLLCCYPRRYVDRTHQAAVTDLVTGDEAMALVRVASVHSRRTRKGRTMVMARAGDETGSLDLTFFNQPWRERQLAPGTDLVVFGKVELFRGQRQMTNPVVDLIGDRTGRIVPIYPQSEKSGLATWELAGWIDEALRRSAPRGIADPVPPPVRAELGLAERGVAFNGIHRPAAMTDVSTARDRLVFDELLRIQLALVLRKRAYEADLKGVAHRFDPEVGLLAAFRASLPFPLTEAQQRVIGEILGDMVEPTPMHRLLQGDVGSGKTVVALLAILAAVEGGHQGALMAPTEVLAEQHLASLQALLADFVVTDPATLLGERGLNVRLLTNRVGAAQRRRILEELAAGSCDIVVGTHALISEGVEFASLGMVVVDEQHRFGVEQRAALREKGAAHGVPDVLVMTATPIPRTAAMTVYGDLDVSVLDELPPGRLPVRTEWVGPGGLEESVVWVAVRDAVAGGHQAYVVCPLIEESAKLEVASAEATFERLRDGELADCRLGLLHGRVAADERDAVMARFRSRELDVLVATTVIEVGVDIPNATIMVVIDADRFGIAQLHQLRGRVGRGSAEATCYLLGEGATADAEQRLAALVASNDGFELAEVDLELRGEGTIMGERQKGRNDLRLASLRRDRAVVETARRVAFELVDPARGLAAHPELLAEVRLFLGETEADFLMKS